MKDKDLFKRYDIPLSFRVEHKTHKAYKKLPNFKRKAIQYKFNVWIKKQLDKL